MSKTFRRNISVNLETHIFIGAGIGYDWNNDRFKSTHSFLITLPFLIIEIRITKQKK